MLRQRKPMARTAFERKPPTRVTLPLDDDLCVTIERVLPRLYRIPAPSEPVFRPSPKFAYVDDEGYRRAVASLDCHRCGIGGYTQCCHSDSGQDGKGGSIKACDLSCWPGCGPRLGEPGCHWRVGHGGELGRDERREFEQRAAADTQATLIAKSAGDVRLRAVLVRVGLLA